MVLILVTSTSLIIAWVNLSVIFLSRGISITTIEFLGAFAIRPFISFIRVFIIILELNSF